MYQMKYRQAKLIQARSTEKEEILTMLRVRKAKAVEAQRLAEEKKKLIMEEEDRKKIEMMRDLKQ